MVKKNYKMIIGAILGLMISSIGVYAVNTLSGNEVSYNNEKSELTSDTVQGAIDELYQKAKSCKEYIHNKNPNNNIEKAYMYNEDQKSSTYCVSGTEESCFVTSCYENKTEGVCPVGTIIYYKVNNNITEVFHVIHDDGKTMTLQSQKNIVNETWNEDNNITTGPTKILQALESKTGGWTNVNQIEYEAGTTPFNGNAFTSCKRNLDDTIQCESNTYILAKRTVRARMITAQEAGNTGCLVYKEGTSDKTIIPPSIDEYNQGSCPDFMHNYLLESTKYGGSYDNSNARSYWTMSTGPVSSISRVWLVFENGCLGDSTSLNSSYNGARAVVEINK